MLDRCFHHQAGAGFLAFISNEKYEELLKCQLNKIIIVFDLRHICLLQPEITIKKTD